MDVIDALSVCKIFMDTSCGKKIKAFIPIREYFNKEDYGQYLIWGTLLYLTLKDIKKMLIVLALFIVVDKLTEAHVNSE